MLSKRRFLTGSASLAGVLGPGFGTGAAKASDPRTPTELKAVTQALHLKPGQPDVAGLRYEAPERVRILRARLGDTLGVQVRNGLSEATSFQWHGLRGLGALQPSGTKASPLIEPGQGKLISIRPNDSGTMWFHADPLATHQTARGLRGMLIVEDRMPPAVDEDVDVFLEDWSIDAHGGLSVGSTSPAATALTVNGEPTPLQRTAAPGARVRLRLVNGSVQRAMVIVVAGARPKVVAIDGQPSALFEPTRGAIPMAPGARFDLLLDLPAMPGMDVSLALKGTEMAAGVLEPDQPLLSIRAEGNAVALKPPIVALPPNPVLPPSIPLERSKRADVVIDAQSNDDTLAWRINGVSGGVPSPKPVLRVRRGDAVTFGLINRTSQLVPLRLHGHVMRLLHAKDDGWEPYWRDTVLLPPGTTNHVAFVADTPGRWPITSAFDAQTIGGLAGWFETGG